MGIDGKRYEKIGKKEQKQAYIDYIAKKK